MELDDLKNAWDDVNKQANEKQFLTNKMFDKMDKKKFDLISKRILLPELLGSIVCIGFAIFIALNFGKLDTAFFRIAGLSALMLFVFLPTISLWSIKQLYKSADINKPYADTLKNFAMQKIKFCKLQKLNITLSYLLLVAVIFLSTRLFGKNAITDNKYFFIISFGFGYIVLLGFSDWVFKKYNKTIRQTEELLNDLTF